ncbi:hypothetical protein DEU56DRAFT_775824 [Suillus clintonianus]|uniref:uncharacterized protein n=1 Tax=Suillus clintonianus TaxID=1904413 RepID=UPI001B882951|nr:uncharacterized protein DEU56DRAFT_775824 [Suillus clintonianus]KAG2152755.1 hypothetical protein DEU56DRAFT_775824 [Suillus clintonianus]
MLKSPRKKSVTPSRPPRRNGSRQASVKREPPEIDLSAIRPPSPTEDPLLLSARRAGSTARSRLTPLFSSSSPYRHTDVRDTQSAEWTDTESEGEGEYTGRFKMFHVPTKADPPTSETRARMEEWGRPVSPFPYEARLDRSLPDPVDMEVADSENEDMEGNILDALDIESVFEDIVEVPPASDDQSSDPPTSDFHVGAEESEDSDVDVESNVVRITGSDPKAAARAAAILKLHDYDCVLASSKRAAARSRTTFLDAGVGKRRSSTQSRRAVHKEDATPWCNVEDIMQDITFIEQHTPIKMPLRVSLGHNGQRMSRPSSATCAQPRYKPKAGEWRREDWKLLDKCFFEERRINGVITASDEVNREAVVMRFQSLAGGHDVVTGLGPPWSWENLLARVDVLIRKRAARADLSTLSFASFVSPNASTLANFTSTPSPHTPRYRDLFDEASAIDTTNIPISTPSYAARSQPTIVPPNYLPEKTGFFSKLPTWASFLPRRVHIKPDDHPDCPPLPPPPANIIDRRKPILTPARKLSEQRKPHKDFVNLHHTTPQQKRAQLRRNKPKRLVELRHISPEPVQRGFTGDYQARRSSGGSVKDLIQCFEGTIDLAGEGGSIRVSPSAVQNRHPWKP